MSAETVSKGESIVSMSPNSLLLPELREMLAKNDVAEMQQFCSALHPASTADFMVGLTPTEICSILRNIDPATRADIFSYFDEDLQVQIFESAPRDEIADFIPYLPSDDRVDILDEVEPKIVDEILPMVPAEDQIDIQNLSAYPEDSCGAEMSTDYVRLREDMTFRQALDEISRQSETLETLNYLYVIDAQGKLVGLVSAKELLRHISRPDIPLSDYMKRDVIAVHADQDREVAASLVRKYDFTAIPVVDDENKMLGIITHDDVLDAVVEEMAEDAHLAAGVAPLEEPYLSTSLWQLARNRFMWLAILLFGAISTAFILNWFEDINHQIFWLATFLPMIVSTGGNSGGQSATLVITALATGQITLGDWYRILRR
ncbi:MAG: magnesium transporter, partial [Thermoguttaceae bacterium]|nr:magnesium transporter [Thermoguttaceae bacterium]